MAVQNADLSDDEGKHDGYEHQRTQRASFQMEETVRSYDVMEEKTKTKRDWSGRNGNTM